jgi:hypothetical protein
MTLRFELVVHTFDGLVANGRGDVPPVGRGVFCNLKNAEKRGVSIYRVLHNDADLEGGRF